MRAVERELIRPEGQAGPDFSRRPPFDKTPLDPGYIKGYPPGIRENGGQYTHAALWSVMAFAALGEGDTAAGLFALLQSDQIMPERAPMCTATKWNRTSRRPTSTP